LLRAAHVIDLIWEQARMLGISDRSVLIARRISKFEYPYRNGIKEERSANLRMFRIDHMKTSALDNLLSRRCISKATAQGQPKNVHRADRRRNLRVAMMNLSLPRSRLVARFYLPAGARYYTPCN